MKINVSRRAAVAAALESVNGRATAHTLTAIDVTVIADRAENRLAECGLSKSDRVGVVVEYRPSGPGKSYARKGRYIITNRVCLRRYPTGWFMTECERVEIWADSGESLILRINDSQRSKIVDHALKGFLS